VLRIYPAFLVALALNVGLNVFWFRWAQFDPKTLALNLLFINGCPWVTVPPYNYVTWSLFYEFAFYIVAPWAFLAFRRDRPIAGVLPVALGLLMAFAMPRSGMFAFGAWLGAQSDVDLEQAGRALPDWLVALVYAAVAASYHLFQLPFLFITPLYGVAASWLFLKACYGRGWLHALFRLTPLRWLGNVSYSFYLIHSAMLSLVHIWLLPRVGGWRWGASLSAYLVASFLVSALAAAVLFLAAERWYFRGRGTRPVAASVAPPKARPALVQAA
jgi:peptidoglycan/LPS O-acetylase OafA/YrhL